MVHVCMLRPPSAESVLTGRHLLCFDRATFTYLEESSLMELQTNSIRTLICTDTRHQRTSGAGLSRQKGNLLSFMQVPQSTV